MTLPFVVRTRRIQAPYLLIILACSFILVFHYLNPQKFQGIREIQVTKQPSVAVCLIGGARAFELTGPSIVKNVLDVYKNSYVFLHSPLDRDTFKLFLLTNSSTTFASARIITPAPIPEEEFHKQLLTSFGSPNGLQGLLQYFSLVEGCWEMITSYEKQHGMKFDWILRTRLDSYWSSKIPPLSELSESNYTVPYGSEYHGFNDRLGIGNRSNSKAALQRLTWLRAGHDRGYRELNSEGAFKAQLQASNVSVGFWKFPFCILSSRWQTWTLEEWGIPVPTISSNGTLNGAYCRPCRPRLVGNEAQQVLIGSDKSWGGIGPTAAGEVGLCDASGPWDADWADVFDEVVGSEGKNVRTWIQTLTVDACVANMRKFQELWEFWSAPTAEEICKAGLA